MIAPRNAASAHLRAAESVAKDVVRKYAGDVDAGNRFPHEAVTAIREAGLWGLLVPTSAGGSGARFSEACEIGAVLGAECMSTGLIWAMHSQQVAIMVDHAPEQWRTELADIAGRGALVASATAERGRSGTLLRARAPLDPGNGEVRVHRPSPVVSYGEEAGYYLVTMRAGPDRPETDVRFVLLDRADAAVAGDWEAMGMRGTRSIAMTFDATVPPARVLNGNFREVATATAIPTAHLGWASAWYGAARGAYDRLTGLLRNDARQRQRLASELFRTQLGEIRLTLDLLQSMLARLLDRFESMRSAHAPPSAYVEADWTIALNGLKVAGSRLSFEAVDGLIEMIGIRGYLRNDDLGLERAFRDLRSAALMVNNAELLQINATQILMSSEGGDQ